MAGQCSSQATLRCRRANGHGWPQTTLLRWQVAAGHPTTDGSPHEARVCSLPMVRARRHSLCLRVQGKEVVQQRARGRPSSRPAALVSCCHASSTQPLLTALTLLSSLTGEQGNDVVMLPSKARLAAFAGALSSQHLGTHSEWRHRPSQAQPGPANHRLVQGKEGAAWSFWRAPTLIFKNYNPDKILENCSHTGHGQRTD